MKFILLIVFTCFVYSSDMKEAIKAGYIDEINSHLNYQIEAIQEAQKCALTLQKLENISKCQDTKDKVLKDFDSRIKKALRAYNADMKDLKKKK
ncbi:MAG: Unknown protein [uncultured Campylobacterales bacterium]|uniref:Uncharacterized protein n=1 Tax=uncultured Campylobacterales bacterium TaxID=352960 RepID=A0A6S6T6D1_9BACT|nr:MAG: Unknown protein [uncultured Campylobacterales bacterium]